MQKILLAATLLCYSCGAIAQIKFGTKAGFNASSIANSNGFRANFNCGLTADINLQKHFSVQPELVYSGQGASPALLGGSGPNHVNINYLNIPVLLKYKSKSGFIAETGPQLGFLLTAKSNFGGQITNQSDQFRKNDFSWALGLGYISKFNLGIDARFNLGISNINNDPYNSLRYHNDVFQVGLFYFFQLNHAAKK